MPDAIRVLLVEDEKLILGLLSDFLTSFGYSVQRAATAAEARELLNQTSFDAAVIDIQLGQGPSGLDLATVARTLIPDIGLVFLTNLPNPKLLGDEAKANFKNCIYLVKSKLDNLEIVQQSLEKVVARQSARGAGSMLSAIEELSQLSKSQVAVLKLVAEGLSNREIAAARGTTIRAVETLLHRALEALGIEEAKETNLRVIALREYLKATGQLRNDTGRIEL